MRFRTYCNKCKTFTIFDVNQICEKCKEKYTDVTVSKIPKKEVDRHEIRLKNARLEKVNEVLCKVIGYGDFRIIECEFPKPAPPPSKEVQKIKPYLELSRNDKCACGSEKKYKNCCMKSVTKIKNRNGI